jgi:hypothetical protein
VTASGPKEEDPSAWQPSALKLFVAVSGAFNMQVGPCVVSAGRLPALCVHCACVGCAGGRRLCDCLASSAGSPPALPAWVLKVAASSGPVVHCGPAWPQSAWSQQLQWW